MRLANDGRALLEKIVGTLPLLAPRGAKRKLGAMIAMNAAAISHNRGEDLVSVADVMVGLFRFAPEPLLVHIAKKLHLEPAEQARWHALATASTHVPLPRALDDFERMAKLADAAFDRQGLARSLEAFRPAFEDGHVYIKTTTKQRQPRELYVRAGNAHRHYELTAMAHAGGLIDSSCQEAYDTYVHMRDRVKPTGGLVDLDHTGRLQKLYLFHVPRPCTLSSLGQVEGAPRAITQNVRLLSACGFERFVISGVDLRKGSVNTYFHNAGAGEWPRERISRVLELLGLPRPPESWLPHIERCCLAYVTFVPGTDRVERICFSRVFEDLLRPVVELVPELAPFITDAPGASRKRTLILGLALEPRGSYLKLEIDYKATMFMRGFSAWSDLFP